jgi:hypothetical protein
MGMRLNFRFIDPIALAVVMFMEAFFVVTGELRFVDIGR